MILPEIESIEVWDGGDLLHKEEASYAVAEKVANIAEMAKERAESDENLRILLDSAKEILDEIEEEHYANI